jgi:D-sedoheptulose 7-phosphate isomerase
MAAVPPTPSTGRRALKGMLKPRPIEPHPSLPPRLAERLQGALPMIPLTGFLSYHTAFGNDVDPELVFAQLVWALGRPATCSSPSAPPAGRRMSARPPKRRSEGHAVVALTGAGGGRLVDLAGIAIRVRRARRTSCRSCTCPSTTA